MPVQPELIPFWSIAVTPPTEDHRRGNALVMWVDDARGWPMLAMRSRVLFDFSITRSDAIEVWYGWRAYWLKGYNYPQYIPLRPMWPGFAVNSVVNAIPWLGLILTPGLIRRRRRLRRGMCANCGYDLRGNANARCPECGLIGNVIGLVLLVIPAVLINVGCTVNVTGEESGVGREVRFYEAPGAMGPYSGAVEASGLEFISGKIGATRGEGTAFADEVGSAIDAVETQLQQAGLTLHDVVSVTVYLTDMESFATFNEVYATRFAAPYPARATLAASGLPGGARIEIQVIATRSHRD